MTDACVWHLRVPIWEGATLAASELRPESWRWSKRPPHLANPSLQSEWNGHHHFTGETAKARGADGFAEGKGTNRWNQNCAFLKNPA